MWKKLPDPGLAQWIRTDKFQGKFLWKPRIPGHSERFRGDNTGHVRKIRKSMIQRHLKATMKTKMTMEPSFQKSTGNNFQRRILCSSEPSDKISIFTHQIKIGIFRHARWWILSTFLQMFTLICCWEIYSLGIKF